jgi:hypothetical protein
MSQETPESEEESYNPFEAEEFDDPNVPETVKSEVKSMIEDITVSGAGITNVFISRDAETEDPISLGFQFQYMGEACQYINLIEEEFTTFYSDYDILHDMSLSSDHQVFGGDFGSVPDQQIPQQLQMIQENLSPPAVGAILQSSRVVPVPVLESTVFPIVASANIGIEPQFSRVQHEFVSITLQHRMYTPNRSMTDDELYQRLTTFVNTKKALRMTLGSAYLSNGVQVPNDIDEYQNGDEDTEVLTPPSPEQLGTPSRGFQ